MHSDRKTGRAGFRHDRAQRECIQTRQQTKRRTLAAAIEDDFDQRHGEGLISEAVAEDDLRGRRVYTLTRKGRRALSDWLASPLEPDAARNEMLLKFYVGADATPDILSAQVESYRARNESFLELLNEAEKELTAALKEHAGDRQLIYRQLTVRVASARVRAGRVRR